MRKAIFAAIAILLGTAVPLAMAEVALRFMPVNEGMLSQPVNASSPVFRFAPNRDFTWSRGWDFHMVNHAHVNNAGYVNDQDYAADDPRPLMAVVGDSYVEAVMVPYPQTFHARLAAAAAPRARVYTLGASGAPLSQYLAWAKEARERWKARALTVVVIANDFDESLARYKTGPGFHHYVENGDGSLSLRRYDYQPALLRKVVERSHLAKYLLFNVQAHEHVRWLIALLPDFIRPARADVFIGNTSADAGAERVALSQAAVRAFLKDLVAHAGWPPQDVLFVVDGIRYPSGAASLAASYFGKMREFFMAEARKGGFEVLDLDPRFFARHAASPVRFEFPTDGHWNPLAHAIVAEAVAESALFRGLPGRAARPEAKAGQSRSN